MPENRWRFLLLVPAFLVLAGAPKASATYVTPESVWDGGIVSPPLDVTAAPAARTQRSEGESNGAALEPCHDRRTARSRPCRGNLLDPPWADGLGIGSSEFASWWPSVADPFFSATAAQSFSASNGSDSVAPDAWVSGAPVSGSWSEMPAGSVAKARLPLLALDRTAGEYAFDPHQSATVASLLHTVTLAYLANGSPVPFNANSHSRGQNGRGGPNGQGNPHTVPEPSSLLLLAMGFVLVVVNRKRLLRMC